MQPNTLPAAAPEVNPPAIRSLGEGGPAVPTVGTPDAAPVQTLDDRIAAALDARTRRYWQRVDLDHKHRQLGEYIDKLLAPQRRDFTRRARAIIRRLDRSTRWTCTDTTIGLSIPYYAKTDKPIPDQICIDVRCLISDKLLHTRTELRVSGVWPNAPGVLAVLGLHISALAAHPARRIAANSSLITHPSSLPLPGGAA